MNSRNLSMALALFAGMSATAAGPSGIFPNPQEETVGSTAFVAAGASYRLTGASDADADAVSALSRVLSVNAGGTIEIVIGEAGDAAVSSVAANIPQHPQAYYLKVEPSKVTIAGRDGAGTY
ncbi:MAG: glycoside hydrolase family 20 zincin-like fold domain-containing protein, partial [Muribaculaceae bacterium]|nr:glycoside hydrolase family 20 zincin-like fold domain-containing protein [Muribaculaceae bacterium]